MVGACKDDCSPLCQSPLFSVCISIACDGKTIDKDTREARKRFVGEEFNCFTSSNAILNNDKDFRSMEKASTYAMTKMNTVKGTNRVS